MKKSKLILFILAFSMLPSISYSQIVNLMVQKLDGTIDIVEFGYKEGATEGIDESLGEIDVSDNLPDSTGVYIIQQDSLNHNCLTDFEDSEDIFFNTNFSSRKNFRSFNKKNDLYFELVIVNPDSIIGFVVVMEDISTSLTGHLDYTQLYYQDCNNGTVPPLSYEGIDTLHELRIFAQDFGGNDIQTMIFKFKEDFLLSTDFNPVTDNIQVFPNPATDYIYIINDSNPESKFYQIFDVTGRLINSGNEYPINVMALSKGLYFLRIDKIGVINFIKE